MSAPKVSVLVPIFNVEKYLDECLNSIANQTLDDIEIICINDGSTDKSSDIIKKYAKNDPRFIVISKNNSGYGDSMNRGLKKATGKYIGIVESDDFIEPTMFQDLYDLAEVNEVEVVKSNFWYYFEHLDSKSPQWNEAYRSVYNNERRTTIKNHDTKANIIPSDKAGRVIDPRKDRSIFYSRPAIWSAIYRRDFLVNNKIGFLPTPGASYQDTGFSLKVWLSCKRAYFTENAYLHYRQDNEASSVNSPGKVFCVVDEHKEVRKFMKYNKLLAEFGPTINRVKYGTYSWNFKRLKNNLAEEFVKVFSNEFKDAYNSGDIDPAMFSRDEYYNLRDLIEQPDLWVERKRVLDRARLTVVVPIYNNEETLPRLLDSLISQTLKDIEIICINSNSTDGSAMVLDKYRGKDPRIVVISKAYGSASEAKNRGLSLSSPSSEFLMFCDADGFFEPNACEELLKDITKSKSDIAMGKTNLVYSSPGIEANHKHLDAGQHFMRYDGKVDITDSVILNTDWSLCNKIFRKSIQLNKEVWFPKDLLYEDDYFILSYLASCEFAHYNRKTVIYNRVRHNPPTDKSPSSKSVRSIDHLKIWFRLFSFINKLGSTANHDDLLTSAFVRCYDLSLKDSPEEAVYIINDALRLFYSDNLNTLKGLLPRLAIEVEHRLPRAKRPSKANQSTSTPSLKSRLMRRVSHRYRREQHIIDQIAKLDTKIESIKIDDKMLKKNFVKLAESLNDKVNQL